MRNVTTRVLAVPAGLLLVRAGGLGGSGDGLAIRDLDLLGLDRDAVPRAAGARRVSWRWVSPVPRSTVWWVSAVVLDDQGRVFLHDPVQRGGQAVFVGCWRRPDRGRQRRGRGHDGLDHHREPIGPQGVAGGDVGELGRSPDVAGDETVGVESFAAAQPEQVVEAVVVAGTGAHEVVVALRWCRTRP